MSTGLARVTINAPQRRVDVALPEHVPLAELLPDVLRHAGEDLADEGEKHGGWLLRRADGVTLREGQDLHHQGVRDGEVLHLVPAADEWPELDYDDVVEAIAEGARRRGGVWTPATTRTATLVAAAVPLTLGLLPLLASAGRNSTGFVGLGLAALLTLTGTIASRAYAYAAAGITLTACALPYAFLGAATVVTSYDKFTPYDNSGPLAWIGAPETVAGSVAVLLFAAFGAAGVAAGTRFFAAAMTTALLTALTAVISLVLPAVAAAAVLISVLVCGIALLPLLAVRLGRAPRPPITLPAETGPADTLDRAAVFKAVARTDELLAGMLLGHAVLAAGAFILLATAGTLSARLLTAVSAIALLLRCRLFVTRRQRLPLLAGGLIGLLTLGVDLLHPPSGVPFSNLIGSDVASAAALTTGAALIALLIVVAGATYADRPPSPYMSRAADLLDTAAVISVIPVACAVTGLYTAVSGLT
ncbi:type VII secretion integral membrane protein EccD [Actinoplanes sp. GCM10030250]|uniref:type VII secretion integral membrane protein EccD n=1 Tax=Actinoplanes sp. GCM10030250 TaxID=3273376 RepID=UPI00361BD534